MFEKIKYFLRLQILRLAISVNSVAQLAIGFFIFGLLAPLGLAAIESYVPTDATIAVIWPITAVLFLIGVALQYVRESGA